MASRKEEKERLRAERIAAERRESGSQRLRLFAGYAVAGLLAIAVFAGVLIALLSGNDAEGDNPEAAGAPELAYINTDVGVSRGMEFDGREGSEPPEIANGRLEESAEVAGCELGLDLREEGREHFTEEDEDPGWETDPPTSGDHYGVPTEIGSGALADGAYLSTPAMGRVVHALEHGRIAIQYSPDLPEEQQLELKGIFDQDPGGMILFPNPDMEHEVAATGWTQKITCSSYEGAATLDALRNFRDIYRGRGPEAFPIHPPS